MNCNPDVTILPILKSLPHLESLTLHGLTYDMSIALPDYCPNLSHFQCTRIGRDFDRMLLKLTKLHSLTLNTGLIENYYFQHLFNVN